MTCSLAVMTWINLRLENQIAFPWYTTFGVLITLVVSFIASLFLRRAPPMERDCAAEASRSNVAKR
jgi:hypothetical protein